MSDTLGSRGGSTLTIEEAVAKIKKYRQDDFKRVKLLVLGIAAEPGDLFHANDLNPYRHLIKESNAVGIGIRELMRDGFIRQLDHVRGNNPASHGRKSYTYERVA